MRGALLVFALLVAGCGDLKTAPVADGDDASASSSSGGSSSSSSSSGGSSGADASTTSSSSSGGSGGGPYGALPSGYCCTENSECRNRRCVDDGNGQKVCMDECRSQSACQHDAITFTCDAPDVFTWGLCRPPPGFTCLPPSSFQVGTKPNGSCCTPTGNGEAGLECQGGICIARGENPFLCTRACDKPSDCEGPFICQQITAARKECFPAFTPYTCQ